MATNPFYADSTVIAALTAMGALLNSGFIEVYSGAQPADANTAITSQVLLATCPLGSPAFGTPVASGAAGSRVVTMTANAVTIGTAAAGGTPSWFRAYQSDGLTVVMDGSAGASGCDLAIAPDSVLTGDQVAVTAWTITQAE